jgi:hypothetical protein
VWRWNRQSVPKRRLLRFRRRGNTQKNIDLRNTRHTQTLDRCDKAQWRFLWRPVNVFCKINSFLKRKYTVCRTFEMIHVFSYYHRGIRKLYCSKSFQAKSRSPFWQKQAVNMVKWWEVKIGSWLSVAFAFGLNFVVFGGQSYEEILMTWGGRVLRGGDTNLNLGRAELKAASDQKMMCWYPKPTLQINLCYV